MPRGGARGEGQIVISQDATIDYTTEEDVHVVDGADPPTDLAVVAPASLRGHTRTFGSSRLNLTGGAAHLVYAYDTSEVRYTGGEWCSVIPEPSTLALLAAGALGLLVRDRRRHG